MNIETKFCVREMLNRQSSFFVFVKFFVLSLLLPVCLFAQHQLSICAIFQDEGPYLREWIEFHKLQGVEHFYLYNNNSTDDFLNVLDPYIQSDDVTLIDWPFAYKYGQHRAWLAIQTRAYTDCFSKYGKDNDWIAYIDIDEFLFCPTGKNLPDFLRYYFPYGAVGVNWRVFGTSGVETIPADRCLIEVLTKCNAVKSTENRFYKSIVQPKYFVAMGTAHTCLLKKGCFTVDADEKKLVARDSSEWYPAHDKICINHYWTRTEKYFREKKLPSWTKRNRSVAAAKLASLNKCEDTKIQQFVSELRKRLGYE